MSDSNSAGTLRLCAGEHFGSKPQNQSRKNWRRDRSGFAALILRPWPGEIAIPHRSWLANRPCSRVFRIHNGILVRLAATVHNRRSPHVGGDAAGSLASCYTRSALRSSGCIVQRWWSIDRGFGCPSTRQNPAEGTTSYRAREGLSAASPPRSGVESSIKKRAKRPDLGQQKKSGSIVGTYPGLLLSLT